MSSTTSKSGKILGSAKRTLPKFSDEDRCTSIDPDHDWLRCMKGKHHIMNWHECDDGEGWHTWIDPSRRVAPPRHGAPFDRSMITVELPAPEPTPV